MFCIGCKMFSPTPKHIFLSTFYATVIKNVFCLLFRWVLWYDNFEQCDTYRNAVPGLHIKMVVLTVGPFSFSLRMDMGFLINDVDLEATFNIKLSQHGGLWQHPPPTSARMDLNKMSGPSQILLWHKRGPSNFSWWFWNLRQRCRKLFESEGAGNNMLGIISPWFE